MQIQIFRSVAIGALLADFAAANPTNSFKQCKDYVLPVTTSTFNYIWNLPELETDYDAIALTTDLGRWDSNVSFHPIVTGAPATASYQIAGTFCTPTKGGSGTVLLASHGFGFDRRYLQANVIHHFWLTGQIAIGILYSNPKTTASWIMP
jgi:hypothetical protein